MKAFFVAILSLSLGPLAMAQAQASPGTLRAGGVVYPADHVGLWERLRAGNIDQPGSPAYNRWGAGYEQGIVASDRKFTRGR